MWTLSCILHQWTIMSLWAKTPVIHKWVVLPVGGWLNAYAYPTKAWDALRRMYVAPLHGQFLVRLHIAMLTALLTAVPNQTLRRRLVCYISQVKHWLAAKASYQTLRYCCLCACFLLPRPTQSWIGLTALSRFCTGLLGSVLLLAPRDRVCPKCW